MYSGKFSKTETDFSIQARSSGYCRAAGGLYQTAFILGSRLAQGCTSLPFCLLWVLPPLHAAGTAALWQRLPGSGKIFNSSSSYRPLCPAICCNNAAQRLNRVAEPVSANSWTRQTSSPTFSQLWRSGKLKKKQFSDMLPREMEDIIKDSSEHIVEYKTIHFYV